MNFLGHLYFSGDNHRLQVANLFGDFFKGTHFETLPPFIRAGALLHRSIDDFIDHHPETNKLVRQLYTKLPKVAGIAMDLFYDHLLAVHWEEYQKVPLRTYSDAFFEFALTEVEQTFLPPKFSYPSDFTELLYAMHEGDWLYRYQFSEGLEFACRGLSQRISFPNQLHEAPHYFIAYQTEIAASFRIFMNDAREKFLE